MSDITSQPSQESSISGVAIIGLAGRFPGAEDVQQFWDNLLSGRETIRSFQPHELAPSEPVHLAEYVPRRGIIDQAEWMDADFFGLNRLEAEVTDPQHRVFLEISWTALEHAGYDPRRLPGSCGVWAGAGNNHYFQNQLAAHPTLLETAGSEAVMIGNEKDYLATRVAYRLDLRGPAITVVTACSTSLVAVAQAVQALLTYQCDMALAGGSSIRWPQNRGYMHEDGGIYSPDGHCRAFDEKSGGTVFSSGAGCVVLKRLEDALRDGDTVYAVVKGAALNNDGSGKVSFAAPSVDGQAENIALALALAETPAETIDFVEAHGTGTALGDVIEVAAFTQAFRHAGDARRRGCLLGSLKPSTGHMDAAAGIAGLIKAALSLHHGVVPGTVNFQRPNPRLALEDSPFHVSGKTVPLEPSSRPHRAVVAALGIGGTNAHLVLESAPPRHESIPPTPGRILPLLLSARTPMALAAMRDRLAGYLEAHPDADLRDVAFTLARGRSVMLHRSVVHAASAAEAITALRHAPPPTASPARPRLTAMVFPGQGSQYAGMGRELERSLPVFRAELTRCRALLGFDPLEGDVEELDRTERTQPALFVFSYCLARQYEDWGVTADALLGHSIGEYVAATLAGVFSLEDALRVVVARGRAMQAQPPGLMLAVRAAETELELPGSLDLAAVNAPHSCVVSGTAHAVQEYESACAGRGLSTRRLRSHQAFHSRLMDGALDPFRRTFDGLTLQPPRRRLISNLTGAELSAADAISPDYWVRQLRHTVRFAEGVNCLLADHVLLHVGPSQSLVSLARQSGATAVASQPDVRQGDHHEARSAQEAVAELWSFGATVDWQASFPDGSGRRIALPTYPFERRRFCPELTEPDVEMSAPFTATPASVTEATPIPASKCANNLPALQPLFPQPIPPDAAASPPRREALVRELQSQLLRISGLDITAHSPDTPFLSLGFDSLFLTQAAAVLKKHFGVRITFRQLMEDLTSIDALAGHLDAQLPAGQFGLSHPEPAVATPGVAPAASSTVPNTSRAVPFGPFKPVSSTTSKTALTPHQQAHLEQLVADYVAKYPKSKEYTSAHRDHFADPRAVAGFHPLWKEMVFPAVTERSEGACFWDIDGHRWIDVVHGFGSGFFGHRPAFVVEALKAQLDRGFEIGPTHRLAGEVARRIAGFSGQDRVAFANTGSEAVMAAIRIARTVTGRDRIALFVGAYHGIFDEVLARPVILNGERRAMPVAPGIPESACANVLVLEYGSDESLEILRRHGPELAAVLVEPVPSRRPDLAPVDFVQQVRRLTEESGTALVFDEIVLGGRTGLRGAQGHFGVTADLVTYGKVLGGGLPFGVLAGQRRFMDALDGGAWHYGDASSPDVGVTFFAGTFIRHPLALAACQAVLDQLEAGGTALIASLDARTAAFVGDLNNMFASAGVPFSATHFSSLWMLQGAPGQPHFSLLFFHLRLRGIHIWEGRGNFFSTAHSDEHVAALLQAFSESVLALQAAGFFPDDGQPAKRHRTPIAEPMAAAEVPGPTASVVATPRSSTSSPIELPLTPEQQELFLSTQLSEQASVAAHESVTFHLHGPLDAGRLKRALEQLAARHQSLRVQFSPDGRHQRVVHELTPALEIIPANELEEATAAQFLQPFDLTTGPLWRTALTSVSPLDHALVVTVHHLICDGWSFSVMARDLARLYRGEALPPVTPLQAVVNEPRDPLHAAYWHAQFATPPQAVELPVDRVRPVAPDLTAAEYQGRLDAARTARLLAYCRRERTTPNAVWLTAWQLLLHRLTGIRDIVVGTPMAGQAASGHDDLISHQVHFLPLRIAIDEGITARQLLARTQTLLADASDHQQYTLGQLFQDLSLPRPAGRPSFVTTTVTCQNDGGPEDWGGGLSASMRLNPKRRLSFDASLFVIFEESEIRWHLVYQACLFESTTVAHWMRCLETLLLGIIDHPETAIERMEILTPADARRLQHWGSPNQHPPIPSLSVHQLFEQQAARTPDAPALVWPQGSWSYRQLDEQASRFARRLQAATTPPPAVVPILAESSPHRLAAVIGILKTGSSYAPLDPSWPEERLLAMLHELAPRVIAGDATCLARLGPATATLRHLDIKTSLEDDTVAHGDQASEPVAPTAPACLMFTSGSSGRPKAAIIPHQAIVRLAHGQTFARMDDHQTWLQLAPLSFDASTLEIFAPLLHGGRLVLMEPGAPTLRDIAEAVQRYRVTSLWLTAGLFQLMVDERLEAFAPLQQLLTGGDVVSPTHARKARDMFPNLLLINGYGPTENTTFTCCRVLNDDDLKRPSLPIGNPISHTSVFIVDTEGQPCPVGVAGELLTGGFGLALGYWEQPSLSSEKFVDHPHFGRVYRTGDLARWRFDGTDEDDPHGVIDFLGRLDSQLKVRGFRIEAGEVEAALMAHPGVRQAHVRTRGATAAERRLVAWCVPAGDHLPSAGELRAHLKRQLPDFLVPQVFLTVPGSLPLTANGKIDERALPAEAEGIDTPSPLSLGATAPRDPTEQRLHQLMARVLERDHFGVQDDFFELGGDSLRGLALFNLIEREFGRPLPLGTLFAAPTVERLAQLLVEESNPLPSHLIAIQPHGSEPPLFLIHGGDGGVVFYRDAVAGLGPDQPIYALEAPMLTDPAITHPGQSVEAIAREYLAVVRLVRPTGPYRLGGYSFGGVVAYEMACQLRKEGEIVDHLMLFDTDNPACPPRYFSLPDRLAARWRIDRASGRSLPERCRSLLTRVVTGLRGRHQRYREIAAVQAARAAGQRSGANIRPLQIREATMKLMEAYTPPPSDHSLTLFRCRDLNDKFQHSQGLGWEQVVRGKLAVIPIPGTHLHIFEPPHVHELARQLAAQMTPAPPSVKVSPNALASA